MANPDQEDLFKQLADLFRKDLDNRFRIGGMMGPASPPGLLSSVPFNMAVRPLHSIAFLTDDEKIDYYVSRGILKKFGVEI